MSGHLHSLLFAGVLLPVAGQTQQCDNGFGGLRTNTEPVLCPVGINLDDRRIGLRIVGSDFFNDPTIALGARVGDYDPIKRGADFAHPL